MYLALQFQWIVSQFQWIDWHYLTSQHALELRKSAAIKLIKAHTVSYEINSILA